jgi:uncharacterized protein DUF6544
MTPIVVVGLALSLILATGVAVRVGTARFRERYEVEKQQLLRRARSASAGVIDAAAVARLPSPLRKYLEVTHSIGKPKIRTATLKQTGALRAAAGKPWMPFESEQVYSLEPPGFVWLARARAARWVHVMARDRFENGTGNMLIRLLGLFTVADARGPATDQGAGLRYWGEIIAFPESVLDPRLRWEPMDDRHAVMNVEHDGLKLTAVVEFGAEGYPIATHAERYRDVGGKPHLTSWSGYSQDWTVIDGRRFPAHWESVWHLPQGDLSAVKMAIIAIQSE